MLKPQPINIPDLLRRHNLRPDKGLGQNFLTDEAALERIVEAAEIQPGDSVLEIGPGLGSLTRWLALRARQVTAIELDAGLLPPLAEVLAPYSNVRILQGDILRFRPAELIQPDKSRDDMSIRYQVVANIPYYITSPLLRHLLESGQPPYRLVLTVQREVAERICAEAGDLSLLALSVQVYGAPCLASRIPAGAFYPSPKVDSAVVRVDLYPQPAISPDYLALFFRLAKAGFSQKRKTLRNSLSGGMRWSTTQAEDFLQRAGIDPRRRAETLSLEEWQRLAERVASSSPNEQQQPGQEA